MSPASGTGTPPSRRGTSPHSTNCSPRTWFWHVGGRNQLTKDYRGRDEVYGFFGRLLELTEGSFHLDLHAVLADDEHGVALVATSASRGGKSVTINEAHVFHLRDGRVTEFWDATTDEAAFNDLIG